MKSASQTAQDHPAIFIAAMLLACIAAWIVVGIVGFGNAHVVEGSVVSIPSVMPIAWSLRSSSSISN